MDVDSLRGILHERTHHTIEVKIYRILNSTLEKPKNFGNQVKVLLKIWKDRGLPLDTPDIEWSIRYLGLAEQLNKEKDVVLNTIFPEPFSDEELKTVEKLLYKRRSIRQFKDKQISEVMIREIIFAGLMAPQGCNLDARRFIVLRNSEDWKLVESDIPLKNGVMILICQDTRVYKTLRFDEFVPQNLYYDVACAADHMCLMAHAFGLGACWLTHGEKTQKKIRERFQLPETFVTRCHIIVGWPDEAPIKSRRMSLEDAIIKI